jgi:hypothetical protein
MLKAYKIALFLMKAVRRKYETSIENMRFFIRCSKRTYHSPEVQDVTSVSTFFYYSLLQHPVFSNIPPAAAF